MGFEFLKKLPTPEEIRSLYPIDAEIQACLLYTSESSSTDFITAGAPLWL